MAKRKGTGNRKPDREKNRPREESQQREENKPREGEEGADPTAEATAEGSAGAGDGKPTLEELTISRRVALEERLTEELDMLDEAIEEMKKARAEFKATKETVVDYRDAIYQTNQLLREVLRGKWRPEKPDPQKRLGFPEANEAPEATEAQHDPRPEAASLWKSKPVQELGLAKSLVQKLEDEGFPTLGVIAQEFEVMGNGAFAALDLSEKQIEKLRVSVAKFRPKETETAEGTETSATAGTTDETAGTAVEVDGQEGAEVERQEDIEQEETEGVDQEASTAQEDEGSEE